MVPLSLVRDPLETSASRYEAATHNVRYRLLAEDDVLEPNEALDAYDVARILKVSYRTVLRLAERGELPYFRVGDLWRFERKDVEDFIRRSKQHSKKQDQER